MSAIRLIREPYGIDSTFGVLFIDGYFICFTLENSHLIIPKGTYNITFYNSPKNQMVVPLLNNVPNRSSIEIHPANQFDELLGCIAPGMTKDERFVYESRIAFSNVMKLIRNNPNNQITIE